ncbi:DUF2842 domain-containing protein [Sphingomonas endolithica]|uniref:DUF2842 domain-containing protein n=1 Tax=Sphingomonas endolithica TaxID=2972485 RepID=UPI0021AF46BF|nr:DUF2842 domain-containing protein [Sphingomonas sp. ZFBP2030]
MTPSWRKPVGMLAILTMIALWVIAIASLSNTVGAWHWLLQLAFYLVTGIVWLWILPMRRMLQWMETGTWHAPAP